MREDLIAARFSAGASHYDVCASVQYQMADAFIQWLCTTPDLPFAQQQGSLSLTELGCGTGFLTQRLLDTFPAAHIDACDLSANMLAQCQLRTRWRAEAQASKRITFHLADAVNFSTGRPCDWILSSFCLQWMTDLPSTLAFHANRARRLSICLPCTGSFSDWKAAHAQLGVTPSLWPLPHAKDIIAQLQRLCEQSGGTLRHQIVQATEHHDSPLAFARHLRAIGADHAGGRRLSIPLRRVLGALPTPYIARYEVLMVDFIFPHSATALTHNQTGP